MAKGKAMIELALVGGGRMGETHLRAWRRVPQLRAQALVEVDPARRAELAERYAIPGRYATLTECLAAEPRVQAVAVCLPPSLLARTACEVLRAGRHLFVEKPVALSEEEGRELAAEAARRPELTVQVGFHLRHHPYFEAARGVRALLAVRSAFTNSTGLRPQPAWRSTFDVLHNLGVHHFDLWRYLTGTEVDEIQACGQPLDTVSVSARLSGGLVASGLFSHLTADRNELELFGKHAHVQVQDYRVDGLEIQRVGALPGAWAQRAWEWARLALAVPLRLAVGGAHDRAYRRQWAGFARCVLGLERPRATLEDGLQAAAIARAAVESLRTGRPVRP